jgi:hypothetical protein
MSVPLQLSEVAISHLNQTRKWANFLAIIGFISCGFLVLIALFLGSLMAIMPSYDDTLGLEAFGSGIVTAIYLVLAGVGFLIYLYLYRFSDKLKKAINSGDSSELEESFKNLKLYYKLNGIIIIAVLGIYVLAIIIGIVAAAALSF